jgi:hypothetical protein
MSSAVAEWISDEEKTRILDGVARVYAAPLEEALPHDIDLLEYPFTDLGNARRFAAMHRGRFLYAREERTWLEWRDGRW